MAFRVHVTATRRHTRTCSCTCLCVSQRGAATDRWPDRRTHRRTIYPDQIWVNPTTHPGACHSRQADHRGRRHAVACPSHTLQQQQQQQKVLMLLLLFCFKGLSGSEGRLRSSGTRCVTMCGHTNTPSKGITPVLDHTCAVTLSVSRYACTTVGRPRHTPRVFMHHQARAVLLLTQ
jgi:hypothetical protein